jgi:hypothetical protein
MKTLITSSLIICICLLSGCRKQAVKDTANKLYVDLSNIKETGDKMLIIPDSVFENVSYVSLETTDDNLIYRIDKIIIYDGRMYILDKKQAELLLFDPDGRYVNKLSKKGLGPDEYLSMNDFFISDSQVYILARDNFKIMVYDMNFDFVRQISLNKEFFNKMECVSDKIFLFSNYSVSSLKNIYIIDKQSGKVKNKYFNFLEKQHGAGYSSDGFSRKGDSLFLALSYDYAIYSLNEQNYYKYLTVDFGEKNMYPESFTKMSDEERQQYTKDHYDGFDGLPASSVTNLYISEDFLHFSYVYGAMPVEFFRNNKTGQIHNGYLGSTKKFVFTHGEYANVVDDKYVVAVSPENVKEDIDYCNARNESLEIDYAFFEKLKFDDNPVLCIYSLK